MENTLQHLQQLRFRIGTGLFTATDGERIVLPFKRSVVAILIIATFAIVMTVPAVTVFTQAVRDWGQLDDLFGLTSALFSTGWLLGWSMGLLFFYAILTVLVFGRETLILRPGVLEIRLGLPFLFGSVELDPGKITNLQRRQPEPNSGKAWRGPHLGFAYEGNEMEIGSDLDEAETMQLAGRIRELPAASEAQTASVGESKTDELTTDAPSSVNGSANTGPAVAAPYGSLPTLALIAANLLPLFGVLLFNWDLGAIMVLFWAESGIIASYHLLKIWVVRRWVVLLIGPFFIGHFGAFMAVHFLFIYGIFIEGLDNKGPGDSLAEVGQLFIELWPALLALTISHGISFISNYIGRREFRHMTLQEQMSEPYNRIFIMHVTIIIGGGLSLALGAPLPALILLILLKIMVDLRAHMRHHQGSSDG
jgi:hypothetical protein